ncbi:hypothetical protein HBB16_08195 [Pseudonocardia sp. MCCB 268]|nr:hypothetical protein [Pseudonocardia cytotoxica]
MPLHSHPREGRRHRDVRGPGDRVGRSGVRVNSVSPGTCSPRSCRRDRRRAAGPVEPDGVVRARTHGADRGVVADAVLPGLRRGPAITGINLPVDAGGSSRRRGDLPRCPRQAMTR